jgi:hypothetical protein
VALIYKQGCGKVTTYVVREMADCLKLEQFVLKHLIYGQLASEYKNQQ